MTYVLIQTCDDDPEWREEDEVETQDEGLDLIERVLTEDLSQCHGMSPAKELSDDDWDLISRVRFYLKQDGSYTEHGYHYSLKEK